MRRPSATLPLPGEGEVIEMIVDEVTPIADERDDLARRLTNAEKQLAEMKKREHDKN